MNIKIKQKIRTFSVLYAIVTFSVITGAIAFPHSASAWCDKEEDGPTSQCVSDNWDKDLDQRGMSVQDYDRLLGECDRVGDPIDPQRKSNYATCSNAIRTCLEKAYDVSVCKDATNLANIASQNCNDGKSSPSTGTNPEGCAPLNDINRKTIDKDRQDIVDKAKAGCTVTGNNPSRGERERQLAECANVGSKCSSELSSGNYVQNKYNESGYDKYKQCLEYELLKNSKNEADCKKRGGQYYGVSKEGVARCTNNINDFASQQGCEQAGGSWDEKSSPKCKSKEQADARKKCEDKYPNKSSSEYQACLLGTQDDCDNVDIVTAADKAACEYGKSVAPTKPTDPSKDGTGTSGLVKTGGEAGTCGKARTNLIVCDGEGMQALAGVLRIAIFVLTVIVGIAATGGIAYSAVLYAGAQDNAGNTQKAKEMIRNIVIGLIAYGFMIAIITWLVPAMNIKS